MSSKSQRRATRAHRQRCAGRGLVRVGQKVTVTSPALPNALEGQVERVGALIDRNDVFGEDPGPRLNARVFLVRVKLASSEVAARYSNLEVDARIAL